MSHSVWNLKDTKTKPRCCCFWLPNLPALCWIILNNLSNVGNLTIMLSITDFSFISLGLSNSERNWRVAQYAILNMPLWHFNYWAESSWDEADTRKALWPPSICLKAVHAFVKVSALPSLPEGTEVNHWRQPGLLTAQRQLQSNLPNRLC